MMSGPGQGKEFRNPAAAGPRMVAGLIILLALGIGAVRPALADSITVPAGYGYGPTAASAMVPSLPATVTGIAPRSAVDPTDPLIIAKATALGNDDTQIFAYVRDEIGIDPYRFSLRGDHATLASGAGNAVDRASLTISLLRAAGFSARYAQGMLSYDDAQRIIARAFSDPQRAVGCNNPSPIANGRNDFGMIEDARAHTWVEYQAVAAGAWVALDPAFATAAIGQTFTTPTATFDTLPANQQHRVRVRVIAESWSAASAVYGFGLGTTTVLDQSFDTVDLVDRPLTIGHFVSRVSVPSPAFSAITNTYSPYLTFGDSTIDPRNYMLLRGTDFSEMQTTFPLGTTLVTGVFVQIDISTPADGFNARSYQRVLYDRLGYATRQTGGSVAANASGAAVVAPLDLLTVQVSPAWQPLDAFAARRTRLAALQGELAAISAQVLALPPAAQQTPDQVALRTHASDLNRYATTAILELMTASFEGAASRNAREIGATFLVKPWIGSPRLTIAQSRVNGDTLGFNLDIRKNDLHLYPLPGISFNNSGHFERARGTAESVLEAEILTGVTGLPARSFASLFIGPTPPDLVAITRYDVGQVESLQLSADAKARIRDTVSAVNGRSVIAPRQPVQIDGAPYTVWLEADPATGATISTGEDGTHQAMSEYAGLLLELLGVDNYQTTMAKFIGQVNSIGVVGVAFTAALLEAAVSGNEFTDPIAHMKAILNAETGPLANIIKSLEDSGASRFCEGGCGLVQSMLSGLLEGIKAFTDALNAGDPPVPSILLAPPLPPLPAPVAPGTTAGLTLEVVRDARYYVPFYGAELQTVYLAKITNTGPSTDTFRIENAGTNWGGFGSLVTALPQITLAAGASGEIGACIVPIGPLPASGAPRSLGLRVFSPNNPAADVTHEESIPVPATRALSLRVQPTSATLQAGASVSPTLTAQSFGNTSTTATIAVEAEDGLTLSGVPATLSLAAGQSQSYTLNATVATTASSGSAFSARVRGDFGAVDDVLALFSVNVSSAHTQCVSRAAIEADRFGRQNLGATLVRLAGAMDALLGQLANTAYRTDALAELQHLGNVQLAGSIFASYVAPLSAAGAALVDAEAAEIPTILSDIDAALCSLGATLAASAASDFPMALNPGVATNLPTQPVSVDVNVRNATALPRVFDIALTGVPAGVNAVLSTQTVTIPANEMTNRCEGCAPPLKILFTNSNGQARTFDYTVTVTPRDHPALAKTIAGSFVLRADIVRIAGITPAPRAVDAGTLVQATIRFMNSVNAPRKVFAAWNLYDANGNRIGGDRTSTIVLAPGDSVIEAPPFPINTMGLAGAYRIDALVYDEDFCCDPMPNSSASTSFLVGQPLSAALSVSPTVVAPGTTALDYTLTLSRESAPQPVIDLRSSLSMPASTRSFVRRGQYLYVCQRDRVQIVDTQNPDAMTIVHTFASELLAVGYGIVGCNLDADTLVLTWNLANESSFDDIRVVAFDLSGAHATSPLQLNAMPVVLPKRFGGRITFNASHQGSLTTTAVIYNPFSGFIFAQHGNLLRLDFTMPSAPTVVGELYHHFGAGDINDAIYGGPSVVGNALARGAYTLLPTTSATGDGFGTGPGVGRLLSVDTAQLAGNCPGAPNPCIASTLDIPASRVLFDVAAQGTSGIVVGDTLGAYDGRSGSVGNVTLTALDLTNAAAPLAQSTLVSLMLNRSPGTAPCANEPFNVGGTSLQALTDNYYAFGVFNPLSCAWALALIDGNDPQHLRIIPYDVPSVLRQTILDNGKLYALTDTAILVYDYETIAGPAITATVDIPKGTGVTITPASFSTPPTSVDSSDPSRDRYTFYRPTAQLITWQGSVIGMIPGSIRTVANGGWVDYTVPTLGSGTLALDAVNVTSNQSMSIAPARAGANLGVPVTYTITLSNPTPIAVSYTLAIEGIRADWIRQFDASVSVPANGQALSTLVLQAGLGDTQYSDNPFVVTGTASSGFATSVQAVLANGGIDGGPDSPTPVYASTLVALATPIAIGRGGTLPVTLRAHNLANATQNYTFYNTAADPGFSVNFQRNGVTALPNTDTDVVALISVPTDAAPGLHPLSMLLASYGPQISTTFNVDVLAQGVRVIVSPSNGTPATSFSAVVTNTGTLADTFDVSALGLLGPGITLTPDVVTLAAGASQSIAITVGDTSSLPPTTTTFDVQAISRSNTAARARASAQVTIPVQRGIALYGVPPVIVASALPATRNFGVQLANTGNAEDAYTLEIVSTSGAITAALRAANGTPVQALSPLRVPGNSAAQFTVDATLSSGDSGSVSIRATSLSDGAISAVSVLTLTRTGSANLVFGTPGALTFDDQIVGSTSTPRSIVLTNAGNAAFVINTLAIGGTHASDFAVAGGANACAVGSSLPAGGGSCTLYARFAPTALGLRDATLGVAGTNGGNVTIALQGNGVAVPDHLAIEMRALRPYVQYGHTLNYLVTVSNPTPSSINGVNLATTLPAELDVGVATWVCINATDEGVTCTPNGTGTLSDNNVRIPAGGSVTWLLSAPVRLQTTLERVNSTATVTSVVDPGPFSATSSVPIVVYRDSFEPYGDGSGAFSSDAVESSFASSDIVSVNLSEAAGQDIDILLDARANDRSGFSVERLNQSHLFVRLVARDTGGSERTSAWVRATAGETATLALVDSDRIRMVLFEVEEGSTALRLQSVSETTYVIRHGAGAIEITADSPVVGGEGHSQSH